ncbi:protein DA1-related 1-like [Humulus lupulus]|uniref:protein DA1-related 1-like n=1 Tax=Humulus lupulus TaxID=3486 RepID=UPI002B408749|nr:protein DA1-related 1-like [Humulus lupulus]
MGWLNKILKGSSHKTSRGHYHGTYEENHNSGDDFDKDDIELALTLSLSEQDYKGKKVADPESESESESELEEVECIAKLQTDEDEDEDEEPAEFMIPSEEDEEPAEVILPSDEDEDLARVLADKEELLSSVQLEEDEQLARAIQESLSMESPPRHDNGSMFHPSFLFSSGYRICAGCNAEIGNGRYLSCMNGVWHPECFRCHACNQPITDHEYSMSNNHPYHKSCYKERHHPRCDVCSSFIPTNSAGLIEYRAHPFWRQKYCPAHERDGTPRCCSCERMEPRDTKYLLLDDGRKLCLECLDSAIMDTHECQPLYLEIQDFYEGLNMKVEQQIPMLLVERQALNEAMEGEKNGHHHLPETRGLCLSEEQTVTTILKRPKIGAGYRIIDMITEPFKLVRRCEVTAILVLYGLPRLLTGSILAHEMMHAWLRLKGYPNLSPEVEEGICQVLGHMWLDSEMYSGLGNDVVAASSSTSSSSSSLPPPGSSSSKKGKRSDFEKKFGEFFKHQIESDSSTAYGEGFRKGNQAVLKYGLKSTLDHIRMTGSFPI